MVILFFGCFASLRASVNRRLWCFAHRAFVPLAALRVAVGCSSTGRRAIRLALKCCFDATQLRWQSAHQRSASKAGVRKETRRNGRVSWIVGLCGGHATTIVCSRGA